MRFLSIYRPGKVAHPPTQADFEAMGKFIGEALQAGVLLATEGFGPSSNKDLKVRLDDGEWKVTDGPFSETKEVIGGFALMQTKTREELLVWTRRFLGLTGGGECEIHQLEDMSPIEHFSKR